jgi:predicted secreted protein
VARKHHLPAVLATALVAVASCWTGAAAGAQPVAQLSAVRAAGHPGFDRLVFQFAGALPPGRSVTWVPKVVQDASGKVVPLGGRFFLKVVFRPAAAHTAAGHVSWTGTIPGQLDLPVLRSVKLAGDFENVLSFGVGLWEKVPLHVFTLPAPPRVVIDAAVPATGPSRITEKDNGRLVYLHAGARVTVALRTCVSCGDSWHAAALPNASIVQSMGKVVVPLPHPPGTVGFPYESRWVLKAAGAGFTGLRLYETGPQRGAPPIAHYAVRFAVS